MPVTIADKIQALNDRIYSIAAHKTNLLTMRDNMIGMYDIDIGRIHHRQAGSFKAATAEHIDGCDKQIAHLQQKIADLTLENNVRAALKKHREGNATAEEQRLLASSYEEMIGVME